jgi:gamma-glutamylcysteine synthetase
MEKQIVMEKLYEKYIEPTTKEKKNYIGVEIEIPILNLHKEAVDFDVVHQVTDRFLEQFHFAVANRDEEGNICAAVHEENGDILSYDCSYNNLELSFGKEKDLNEINKRFRIYYTFLQQQFGIYDYTLTGMGVNPYRIYNHNEPIPNGRYRMLFHHLHSYKNYDLPMFFHEYPAYGTFSSASQVQLDVRYEELIPAIRAFSAVEPIKALLFSNSVLLGEHEELLCCRDMFWENSTHGINPHNIGMFDCELDSVEELEDYIASTSIYCLERDGKYINFPPVKVMDYFQKESIEGEFYDNGQYRKILIHPQISDLDYLRSFKFEDVTFRGTIEFRSVCCQPIHDNMSVAAFHIGLKEELAALDELLQQDTIIYHHGYTSTELRKMFVKKELPSFVDEDALYGLAKKVVDLAASGLQKRGYGEEKFLQPLYERIKERTNPAKTVLMLRNKGTDLEDIILDYARI